MTPLFENVTRVESWSFFTPPPSGGDPDYTLLGNRATLGVRVDARRLAVQGSLRYAQLVGLPREAMGPGPLGPGAQYYAAVHTHAAYQLYIKSMSLRVKNVISGLSLEAGRMAYESGDGTPFGGRLIGNADWTIFERSFDGGRADYARPSWRAHASFVMPTQGAFEESANPTMSKVQLATASWTHSGVHLFAHHYGDRRAVKARPDNTGFAADTIDVGIQTIGGSFVWERLSGGDGPFAQAWGALQRGSWYQQRHRAHSIAGEGGYRLLGTWRVSITGGASYASGDDNPADDTHGTFFPMLPTTTPALLGSTYAQMNLRDVYARATATPKTSLTMSADIHLLSLASPRDRWYSGTGATAFRGDYFGFSTRASRLATSLGTYLGGSAQIALSRNWSVEASLGVMKGGEVVRRQFFGEWLRAFLIENRLRFP